MHKDRDSAADEPTIAKAIRVLRKYVYCIDIAAIVATPCKSTIKFVATFDHHRGAARTQVDLRNGQPK